MKNIFFLSIIISSFWINTMAQKCGSTLNMQLIQKENPELYNKLLQIENHTNTFIENQSLKSVTTTNIIRIPVVVHVVYNTSSQNISDNQIISQIAVLNEDFRRQNSDASNTPSAFSSVASDSEIEFFLACVDPDGNVTNGITRTQTSLSSFPVSYNIDGTVNETATKIKFTSLGGHDAWPSDTYLNIWTCNLAGGLLGYAQFPGVGLANTDGVVIKYNCFGRTGTLDPTYNKGRTATHEVGHWLNLIHIWGDDDDDNGSCISNECNGTDNVSDTPNQGERNYGCPTFPKTDCCATTSPGVMFMNYMDYTDDACMNLFTAGQTNRMRALFTTGGFRECFVTNSVVNDWCQSLIYYYSTTSSFICPYGTSFSINNLPPVDSIIWEYGPYLTISSGQYTSSCTFSSTGSGNSWVRVRLVSDCGNITLPRETVWAGPPSTPTDITNSYNYPENTLALDELNQLISVPQSDPYTTYFEWDYGGWYHFEVGAKDFVSYVSVPSYFVYKDVKLRAQNTCGASGWYTERFYPGGGYFMLFTPNPTTGETTLSIESTAAENFDENEEWEFEVYSESQLLKEKKTKLIGKSTKIQTIGWQEGIYAVRVKYKDEILTGKLVVKK